MTTGNPPTETLPATQVAELINGLVKALRAYHMYLPNNPIYQRATEHLRTAFLPIWGAMDEVVLTVAETDFVWEDQVVYHQLNKSESLAWGLFKDGMRSLTIRRGAALDESQRGARPWAGRAATVETVEPSAQIGDLFGGQVVGIAPLDAIVVTEVAQLDAPHQLFGHRSPSSSPGVLPHRWRPPAGPRRR